MIIEPDDWEDQLTDNERAELNDILTHTIDFRDLAEGCDNWDDIKTELTKFIQFIDTLQAQGARVIDTIPTCILYERPGEHSTYATYQGTHDQHWHFQLPNGTITILPIDPDDHRLDDTPIGTRVVVLLNPQGEIQQFCISFNQPRQPPEEP